MTTEVDIIAQSSKTLTVGGHQLEIQSPNAFKQIAVQKKALALLLSPRKDFSELKAKAKEMTEKLIEESPTKTLDVDAFYANIDPIIEQFAGEDLLAMRPDMVALLGEICRPNPKDKNDHPEIPKPFDSGDFWRSVTFAESSAVVAAFVELVDVSKYLKNVVGLKGIL